MVVKCLQRVFFEKKCKNSMSVLDSDRVECEYMIEAAHALGRSCSIIWGILSEKRLTEI